MFDFAWSEIGLIAAVALILIGPKDLPVAIRTITDMIKKARRMAGEFQTHVDEMLREANLDEVRTQINQIRNFDIRGTIEKAVDVDGSIRATFAGNPLEPTPVVTPPPAEEVAVAEAPADVAVLEHAPEPASEHAPENEPEPARPDAPAFIPPGLVRPVASESAEPEPPAFIPPAAVLQHRPQPHA